MNVEDLLSRLKKVKKAGPSKWVACCPGHEDRTPSLAIKDDNGTILVHCFGGCDVGSVLGAVGLTPADLFPPRARDWQGTEKPARAGSVRFTALDALRCLSGEASVLLLLSCDMAEGKILSADERDRLVTSLGRIHAALGYLGDHDD